MFKLFLVAAGAILAHLCLAGAVAAQYPEPVGSVTSTGSDTEVTCTLVDVSGDPVDGELIAFEITSNPGDAQLLSHEGISDTSGSVTVQLDPGTVAGQIEVTCTGAGLESTFVTEVAGAISPPDTGDGGIAGSGGGASLVGLIAVLALVTGAILVRRGRTTF